MDSLDQDVLDRLGRDLGAPGAVSRVIAMYLEKLPAESAELHRSAEAGDHASVAEEAHRLKSSTAMLGATRLAEILAGIEAAAKAADAAATAGQLDEFDAERVKVDHELRLVAAS